MKSKKAQGISINTIIIAAIALIVLVVLVMIFTGRMGAWVGGVDSCINKGGECQTICTSEQTEITGTDCEKEDSNTPKCCMSLPS